MRTLQDPNSPVHSWVDKDLGINVGVGSPERRCQMEDTLYSFDGFIERAWSSDIFYNNELELSLMIAETRTYEVGFGF
jgi:hypothetical protein